MPDLHKDVVIVGGGPSGLFLGICLIKKGLTCLIIEQRIDPVQHSRSLGIHPVSLQLFRKYGIDAPFLESGLKIEKGIAFMGTEKLGEISFEELPGDFPFVLSCPQYRTEAILQEELLKLDDRALIRGADFIGFEEREKNVLTHYVKDGESVIVNSRYLAGCDGKNSKIREIAGISFDGGAYPDTYVMGDFSDNTTFASDAAVFIPENGLVECFPLPDGMRRWVVKTEEYIEEPDRSMLEKEVKERTGTDLQDQENRMLSSFGVQHYLAAEFAKGRVFLVGDAAHVVSPIGGQGMNLGWLDGDFLADVITDQDLDAYTKSRKYHERQYRVAKRAMKRAENNMKLGRAYSGGFWKKQLLKVMLSPGMKPTMAKLFTMQHLESWWV
jgi:2-polyprenyl-6-methoxyphenol hydroxylase-like FAD-dependent oxidoreductase